MQRRAAAVEAAALAADAEEDTAASDGEAAGIITEDALAGRKSQKEKVEELIQGGPAWAQTGAGAASAVWTAQPIVRGVGYLLGLYLVYTLWVAAKRVWAGLNSPQAQRKRYIRKNQRVLETLHPFLPHTRDALTWQTVSKIRSGTGFSSMEIFRKYLLFALEQRKFDVDTVADIVKLREVCNIEDGEVQEAMLKIAGNTLGKYGIVTRSTAGLTAEGVAQKATLNAMVGKYLYLAELPGLVSQSDAELTQNTRWQLLETFGCTEEDLAGLRITLDDTVDGDSLEKLV